MREFLRLDSAAVGAGTRAARTPVWRHLGACAGPAWNSLLCRPHAPIGEWGAVMTVRAKESRRAGHRLALKAGVSGLALCLASGLPALAQSTIGGNLTVTGNSTVAGAS